MVLFINPGRRYRFNESGAKVRVFLVGFLAGLAIGVGVTVFYFTLAAFFELNAKALEKEALKPRLKAKGARIPGEETQNTFAEEERQDESKVAS